MSLVPAQKMSKCGYKPGMINSIVKNQIMLIDVNLKKYDKTWGKNVLCHVLPSDFNIPGLPKDKAQKLIYSQIITRCENAGYKVKLRLGVKKNKNVIALIWESEISEKELDTMDNIINRAINLSISHKKDGSPDA
jgi:hypothetical protein